MHRVHNVQIGHERVIFAWITKTGVHKSIQWNKTNTCMAWISGAHVQLPPNLPTFFTSSGSGRGCDTYWQLEWPEPGTAEIYYRSAWVNHINFISVTERLGCVKEKTSCHESRRLCDKRLDYKQNWLQMKVWRTTTKTGSWYRTEVYAAFFQKYISPYSPYSSYSSYSSSSSPYSSS